MCTISVRCHGLYKLVEREPSSGESSHGQLLHGQSLVEPPAGFFSFSLGVCCTIALLVLLLGSQTLDQKLKPAVSVVDLPHSVSANAGCHYLFALWVEQLQQSPLRVLKAHLVAFCSLFPPFIIHFHCVHTFTLKLMQLWCGSLSR